MLLALAIWLQNTPLFEFLRESEHGYEILLSLHVASIAVFAATVVISDLRLLGWALRDCAISSIVNQLRALKRVGFISVVTFGFLLFGMKAEEYYYNDFFRFKVLLLVLVAVHALIFRHGVYRKPVALDQSNQAPAWAKLAAGTSLALWLCLVCAGRGIGYLHAPPFSHHFAML